jgi:hypothetical protein
MSTHGLKVKESTMIDRTNAERQRRYISRLKADARLTEQLRQDNERLRKRIALLRAQIVAVRTNKETP